MSRPSSACGTSPPGEQVAGQQYVTEAANSRRVAHLIGDAIFTRITGEKGFFDSHVVFVDETGPAEKRRKRLAIMDMDGGNVKYLTRGENLVVTPRFSPSAQQIAYMSFGNDDPKVSLLNIETGQHEAVGNFPGMTFSPRFSPDGRKIIMSLSEGATSNLYTMDLALAHDDAPHRHRGDRHLAVLFARRIADRLRIRPRRRAADLYHERERRPRQAHFVRRRALFDAGLVAARRHDRFHAAERRRSFGIGVMKPDGSQSACSPKASTTKGRPSRPTACS